MDCRRLEKWVWQEGAGNLPAGAVEHAAVCPDCRALIERIRLLDRSIGASITPDPDEAYWDAMANRIAVKLDHPTDRVVQLIPIVPAWRRLVGRAWAPTMAVALLAVIASQKTTSVQRTDSLRLDGVPEKIAELSSTRKPTTGSPDQSIGATEETRYAAPTNPESVRLRPSLRQSGEEPVRSDREFAKAETPLFKAPTVSQPTMATSVPPGAQVRPPLPESSDQVWPERQVIIMGQVDSNSPNAPLADDRRLAGQDPFGAYERQLAEAEHGEESVSTFASPGRLLDGPAASAARGSERLTPAEQMRRFDEMAELHDLIDRLEEVPESSRAMSQWTQWSTAWYRLGMLSQQASELDSAITAVSYFQVTVPMDSAAQAEWLVRKTHLENRRENLVP